VTTVALDVSDGIARLTLDRPDARNTISLEVARDLHHATEELAANESVRAVLLSGRGDTFCAGGDLKSFHAAKDMASHIHEVTSYLHPAIENLDHLHAPIVAAVRGAAAGAGLGLACVADIVLASTTARFVSAYTKIGLTPDGSTSWWLPRLVGLRRALELTLTNRVLDAEEASVWGLVTRVVDDEQLDKEAETLVAELASGPTGAFAGARRLIRDSLQRDDIAAQLTAEQDVIVDAAETDDAREGISAFLEKRAPRFGS
jgi:2-(1,2-epoxy-1,2-dihydrophenyl)acetyl-CoA isomerase